MKGQNLNHPDEHDAVGEDEQTYIERNAPSDSVLYRVADYHRSRGELEIPFQDGWDQHIAAENCSALEQLLASKPDEGAMQKFLKENGIFLLRAMKTNNSRRVIAKPRLGSEYVPDFLMVYEDSMGFHWYGVELESPRKRAARRDGKQTADLTQAVAQIRDWRRWISDNKDYARRSCDQDGLGLIGIDHRMEGLILIGRRTEYSERFNDMRREMLSNDHIEIHSYDWLLDIAKRDSQMGAVTESN